VYDEGLFEVTVSRCWSAVLGTPTRFEGIQYAARRIRAKPYSQLAASPPSPSHGYKVNSHTKSFNTSFAFLAF
jgi:hypothetical protein